MSSRSGNGEFDGLMKKIIVAKAFGGEGGREIGGGHRVGEQGG